MHLAVPWVFPEDIDIHSVPSEFRTGDTDWSAVFNPTIKRKLDVQLVHKLIHDGCVISFGTEITFLFVSVLYLVSCSHWMASTLPQHSVKLYNSMRSRQVS